MASIWDSGEGGPTAGAGSFSEETIVVAFVPQNTFTLTTFTYVPGAGQLMVFVNGVYQKRSVYTELSLDTIRLDTFLEAGEEVTVVKIGA